MRLFPLLLLLPLLVPAACADAVQSTGGAAHDGFRLHDDRLHGTHVDAETSQTGLGAVTLDGTPLLAAATVSWTGAWAVDGPLATLVSDHDTLRLHDNPFGWLSVRGDPGTVTLTGVADWVVADGQATSGPARVHAEHAARLDADGNVLTATFEGPTGLAVTTEDGIYGHAPRAGAWAVVRVDPDDPTAATADWLSVRDAPFRLTDAGPDRLEFDLIGTLGDGAPDLLVRLDLHGLDPHGGLVLRMADMVARHLTADAVTGEARGPLSFNATTTPDGRVVLLRLPAGLSGHLVLTRDGDPARLTVSTHDLDPWAPQERIPTLLAVADEPGTATLLVGDGYEKRTLGRAYEHTFRLVGLTPGTEYPYQLRFEDLAGNEVTVEGTLRTGNATGGSRHIDAEALPLPDGAWRITANVTDVTGAPVRGGVAFFVDKQATPPTFVDGVWVVELDGAAPGQHEVAVEALGPDGRVREVLWVTVEAAPTADAPLPALLAAAALLAAVAVRRARPPQS